MNKFKTGINQRGTDNQRVTNLLNITWLSSSIPLWTGYTSGLIDKFTCVNSTSSFHIGHLKMFTFKLKCDRWTLLKICRAFVWCVGWFDYDHSVGLFTSFQFRSSVATFSFSKAPPAWPQIRRPCIAKHADVKKELCWENDALCFDVITGLILAWVWVKLARFQECGNICLGYGPWGTPRRARNIGKVVDSLLFISLRVQRGGSRIMRLKRQQ